MPLNLPLLHGNWVDLILIIVLFWFFIDGIKKGLLENLLELLGFLASFVSALKFYSFFSLLLVGNFSLAKGIADALGFFIAGLIGQSVYSTIAGFLVGKIPKRYVISQINRNLGFIPSLLNGLIVIAFILTVIISLPVNPALKSAILSSKIGAPLVSRTQKLEQQINKIFGGAVSEGLNFLTVKPIGGENVDLHFKTQEFALDAQAEEKMLNLVNQERKNRSIRTLSFDAKLQTVARTHAKDMLIRGYFSHNTPEGLTPFDRMNKAGISYETAGENLAFAPNVDIAHTGLMNSPGHRANILNPDFGKAGIGVINGGIYGEMFVQEFTN